MKKISIILFVILALFIGLSPLYASNIDTMKAVIIIADNYINPINNGIAQSVKKDYETINGFLNFLNDKGIVNVEKTILQGREATVKNIKNAIKNLNTNKNDILFVYYSGHGGMSQNRTFIWPCDENMLFRDEFETMVNNKRSRLKFVFSDACSSSIDSMSRRLNNMISFNHSLGSRAAGMRDLTDVYRKLFYDYKGLLYVTAASEGEYAWGDINGGAFTTSLITESMLQDPKGDWEKIIETARKSTEQKFKYNYRNNVFDSHTKEDLRRKNIDNQKPKVYSMVNRIKASDNDISTTNDTITKAKTEANITNYTNFDVSFTISDSKGSKYYTIGAYDTITIKSNDDFIVISYDKGNSTYDEYSLVTDSYHFQTDAYSLISIYQTMNSDNEETSLSNEAKVILTNYSGKTITFYIDYGDGEYIEYSLDNNYFYELTGNEYLYIAYDNNKGEYDYYALEQGSYEFTTENNSKLQLYYVDSKGNNYDDSYYNDYYSDYSKRDIIETTNDGSNKEKEEPIIRQTYLYNDTGYPIPFTAYYSNNTEENITLQYGYEYYMNDYYDVEIAFQNGYKITLELGEYYFLVYDPYEDTVYLLTYEEYVQFYEQYYEDDDNYDEEYYDGY